MPTVSFISTTAPAEVAFAVVTPIIKSGLTWDNVGDKVYETGLDRGVLYLADGRVVPWNGLTSVVENINKESASVYFDGMKISSLVSLGDFSATMKALTYPDEFIEIEGLGKLVGGVFLGNQRSQVFNLSYRTLVGNDVEGDNAGYKLHILYNVTVVPSDKSYTSITDAISPVEFEWNIVAVPEDITGYSPTAHIIINSLDVSPSFMQAIEHMIYGNTAFLSAHLPSMSDLIAYLQNLSQTMGTLLLLVTDNGDGTWTATTDQTGVIVVDDEGLFYIIDANATFAGDSYELSDTFIN